MLIKRLLTHCQYIRRGPDVNCCAAQTLEIQCCKNWIAFIISLNKTHSNYTNNSQRGFWTKEQMISAEGDHFRAYETETLYKIHLIMFRKQNSFVFFFRFHFFHLWCTKNQLKCGQKLPTENTFNFRFFVFVLIVSSFMEFTS